MNYKIIGRKTTKKKKFKKKGKKEKNNIVHTSALKDHNCQQQPIYSFNIWRQLRDTNWSSKVAFGTLCCDTFWRPSMDIL